MTLEKDHLDYYKNFNNILKTFKKFILHLPKDGVLVANKDDENIKKLLKEQKSLKQIKKSKSRQIKKSKSTSIIDNAFFTIVKNARFYSLKDKEAKKIKKMLKVPGEFNVSNALAALAVARILEIPDKISFKSLSEYKCSWRRFEITKILKPVPYTLIDDYGHHSTQVKVTLKAAKEKYPKKEIWCVYQPHQYQRTYYLFNDFVKAFKKAPVDKVIITDIYSVAGREKKEITKKVSSKKLVKAVNKPSVIYIPQKKLEEFLKKNLKPKQVLIIMGAGDIYNLSLKLKGQH